MQRSYFSFYFNPQGPRGPRPPTIYAISHQGGISIHKALAGLDFALFHLLGRIINFNPQGPRGPRLHPKENILRIIRFQSTRPSRASTHNFNRYDGGLCNFNPQGPRGPRLQRQYFSGAFGHFNPQGPRGPRHYRMGRNRSGNAISIHKALAGLDSGKQKKGNTMDISIHKALAGLDCSRLSLHFLELRFQSTRPSRASTCYKQPLISGQRHFNPQGPRGPRRQDIFSD